MVAIDVASGAAADPELLELSLLVATVLEHDARTAAVTAPTAARATPTRANANHLTWN
ncbi:MAG TPA: hypothetical protein VLX59_18570 [Acidimicrobiales bacterium]|nr:hypothetical protein [Acidimicrobiales bacterium]